METPTSRIPALLDELEPLITAENFQKYKDKLQRIGVMIDAEDFFSKHPVERATKNG